MHECPICGEICDCDMDDTGGLPVPPDCPHICEDDDGEEIDPTDEDYYPADDDEFTTWDYDR